MSIIVMMPERRTKRFSPRFRPGDHFCELFKCIKAWPTQLFCIFLFEGKQSPWNFAESLLSVLLLIFQKNLRHILLTWPEMT